MNLFLVGIYETTDERTAAEFSLVEERLIKKGHTVINPMTNRTTDIVELNQQLLSSDAVVLLRGWECSDKASAIVTIAHILSKQFYFSTPRRLLQTGVASELRLIPLLPSDFLDQL